MGRVIVAVIGAMALGWAASAAMGVLRADVIVHDAAREMATWNKVRPSVTSESWQWMLADLEEAERLDPRNPAIHELLGILKSRRTDRAEYLGQAAVHFRSALELRPVSAYAWANMVELKYQLGAPVAEVETLIGRAAALGPWEPAVQQKTADFGLALWDELRPGTRAVVDEVVARGMHRNPLAMLQISERRGRLDAACRHVPAVTRTADAKWSKLCPSTEATP